MPTTTRLDELDGEPHATVFGSPRTVRLSLDAGESVPEHTHPDANVVIYVVEGELTVSLDGTDHDVEAGTAVRFDGQRSVSPTARTDACALVVLAPKDSDPNEDATNGD